jgi:hypothetical protein
MPLKMPTTPKRLVVHLHVTKPGSRPVLLSSNPMKKAKAEDCQRSLSSVSKSRKSGLMKKLRRRPAKPLTFEQRWTALLDARKA